MAKGQKKVIISCAVTGGIHTPSLSPYLPSTPEQIAAQAIDAAKAGAAVLHIHARREDGMPVSDFGPSVGFCPLSRMRSMLSSVLPPAALRA